MKIFNLIKRQCDVLGLHRPSSHDDEISHYNMKNFVIILGLCVTSTILGIPLVQAKTISDFSKSYMGLSSSVTLIYMYFTLIWRTSPIHKMIEHFEEQIQKCKFQKFNKKNIACIRNNNLKLNAEN